MPKVLLKGTVANQGEITAIVFVIKKPADIAKFKSGSILVATMTNPAYVPAMMKAVGIITDIGGITCHAAIIARELGVPCVVGTKVASQILKTGQVVTIDAQKGIVYA